MSVEPRDTGWRPGWKRQTRGEINGHRCESPPHNLVTARTKPPYAKRHRSWRLGARRDQLCWL